jgi:hypothetical protein
VPKREQSARLRAAQPQALALGADKTQGAAIHRVRAGVWRW